MAQNFSIALSLFKYASFAVQCVGVKILLFDFFFSASNAGSELYLSTNEKPETKSLINYVSGGFATYQYEYDR